MMNNPLPIQTYFRPGNRVHLVGIGGVSMCPLAEILQGMGLTAQGSDISNSAAVEHLRTLGIPVAIASDFNPGSCPSLNLHLCMTIACARYKMTPEEVLTAVEEVKEQIISGEIVIPTTSDAFEAAYGTVYELD